MKEIAIIDASTGSVALHTLPQHVRDERSLSDHLAIVLEVNSDSEYITADKIIIDDFRTKPN